MRIFRLFYIITVFHQYGLYQILKKYHKTSIYASIIEFMLFFIPQKHKELSLPTRTKLAFEHLGPVMVKFGQLLSTRQDLIPEEFINELSKLQSQVKPFNSNKSIEIIENSLHSKIASIFSEFSQDPVASASIAQVHKATLKHNNQQVAVKVLRPNIEKIINSDIKLMKLIGTIAQVILADGKRLKLREVINEFEKTIFAELDFLQEAANATELYRLHQNDNHIRIPKVYYDYCTEQVLVLEWMNGIPISDINQLRQNNIDLIKLSNNGVEIFYTQVFNFGFFHADMHPGNILCTLDGAYIALDFGIVGCLSEYDKRYLAINIWAFFNRDYKKVALTHIESGWAPANTSIEELESAIRTVCEPIFNKPLSQISFGQVLIKLFQVSRKFDIAIQPQLVLLQKTIINIEGLGRTLNPNLDLWQTAKPILEKWMHKQMGVRGLLRNIKQEFPYWTYILPQLPKTLHETLYSYKTSNQVQLNYQKLIKLQQRQNYILILLIVILVILFIYKF